MRLSPLSLFSRSGTLFLTCGFLCSLGNSPATANSTPQFNGGKNSITLPGKDKDWNKLIIPYELPGKSPGNYGILIGNGRFGAEQSGGISEDVFQLNHKGFWSGDPEYTEEIQKGEAGKNNSEVRLAALKKTRQLLAKAYSKGISPEERLKLMREVESTAKGMWCKSYQATYLPLGNMRLHFPDHTEGVTDYKRHLDMDGATAHVSYVQNGVTYTRQSFASYPDKVICIKIGNDKNVPMNMTISLDLPKEMQGQCEDNKVTLDSRRKELVMTGRAPIAKTHTGGEWKPDRGVTFESRAKVIHSGGTLSEKNGTLEVTGASQIHIIYSCESSYKDSLTNPAKSGIDVSGNVKKALDKATLSSYPALLKRHQEDFRSLFRRVWIDLKGESIKTNGAGISPEEYVIYYQYGRYIMISGERKNTQDLPLNLTGMWNYRWSPPNESAYFLNENLQKMHAVGGSGNLSDTSEPYWRWIKNIAHKEKGGKTAQESFGIKNAWAVSHSSDAWCKTELYGDSTCWANWNGGGFWIVSDLYNAYDFSRDIEFLEEYYPVMEGAARFALGNLMKVDGTKGELEPYLVFAPSSSPEHWYVEVDKKHIGSVDIASTSDLIACRNLFRIIIKASEELEKAKKPFNTELVKEVKQANQKLPPLEMYIDKETGLLKEWYNEYHRGEDHHRHASHLMGFFFNAGGWNEQKNPELFQAAKKELLRLGNLGGGYHPDIVTMGLHAGLPQWGLAKILETNPEKWGKQDLIWKWFPISAPVVEALVDSRFDELNILPTLPEEWKTGEVSGIRARGAYQLSIKWENNELIRCIIDSPTGKTPVIKYKGKVVTPENDSRFTINKITSSVK